MPASPAIRYVFALAVALLSAAPLAARDIGNSGAPTMAEMVRLPLEEADEGRGVLAPVVAASVCNAEINGDGVTDFASVDASAVRLAVAAVAPNGTVKIAGYCSGVATQGGTTQTALITRTITLAGGYTTTDWTTYNPAGNPTTLDALLGGRVISAPVAATLRGFTVTGGYNSSATALNGGGISAVAAMTLTDMIVSGNIVTGASGPPRGGGAYIGGPARVTNATFRNNASRYYGGGLFANSTLTLSATQFLGNTAGSDAGGAYAEGATTISGGLFQSNASRYYGGGLFANSTLTLTGTQFVSNIAGTGGGGAHVEGATTLNGGLFLGNASGFGGGLGAFDTLALSGTQFLSNTAGTFGGGAVAFGVATLNGGLLQSNASGGLGGGLYANSTLALTSTRFLGNTAVSGGGLYLFNANARRVVNALFARNSATANGAAIYVNGAAPLSLIHTTIVSPTAPMGGAQAVYAQTGTVYLTNTLIATHTIGIGVAGGTVGDRNTLFAGVSTPYTGTITSVGVITGTAGFVNAAIDNYHLGAGSAAVNAGIDAGVYTDFEGQSRPQAGGYDIGYDEYFFGPKAYLPSVVR
jgi:predicted outer membrane repeat protein